MKNILWVSLAFPPKSDPESIQNARYLEALAKNSDISFTVITSALPTLYMPVDNSLKKYIPNNSKIIPIKLLEFRILNSLLHRITPSLLQFPDPKWSFIVKGIKKAIAQKNIDIIYSRSFPISSTILALEIKKHTGKPWVMHLSDPWVDSPLHEFKGFSKRWNTKKEKECFDIADKISFTNQRTLELYSNKYPQHRSKYFISYNVFDDEFQAMVDEPTNLKKQKLTFVYAGGLATGRDPYFLLEAISELNKNDVKFLETTDFVFAGAIERRYQEYFKNFDIKNVKHLGLLPFAEAFEVQQKADILVLIDTPVTDVSKAFFFPSKLLDYFLVGKPILAITNRGSIVDELLKNSGHVVAYYENKNSIKEALVNILTNSEKIKATTFLPPQKYSAKKNAEVLNNVFNEL